MAVVIFSADQRRHLVTATGGSAQARKTVFAANIATTAPAKRRVATTPWTFVKLTGTGKTCEKNSVD